MVKFQSSKSTGEPLSTTKIKRTRANRIRNEVMKAHPLFFNAEPQGGFQELHEIMWVIFGEKGVGKTTFAWQIGDQLQYRFALDKNACFFIMAEKRNNSLPLRGELVPNWLTFIEFVTQVSNHPEIIDTTKIFVIDPLDTLIESAIDTMCGDYDITEMHQEGFSRAWKELRAQLLSYCNVLRSLVPGLLIISHQRYREVKEGIFSRDKASMDLGDKTANVLGAPCSMIVRMRIVEEKSPSTTKSKRCLSCLPNDREEVKDNLDVVCKTYSNGIIPVDTPRKGAQALLDCFDKAREQQSEESTPSSGFPPFNVKRTKKKTFKKKTKKKTFSHS